MSQLWPFLRAFGIKAWWEQKGAVLGLWALSSILSAAVYVLMENASPPPPALRTAGLALVLVLVFSGPVFAHRFVARELTSDTTAFLDGLPLWPQGVLLFQLVLGGLALSVAAVFPVVLGVALQGPGLPEGVVASVIVRAALATFLWWCVLALFSLLGRYRIPLAVFAFGVVIALITRADIDPLETGPLSMLNRGFGRTAPLDDVDVLTPLLLGALFIAAAAGLAWTRDRSGAMRLAQRMTQREKVFFFGLVISGLFAWFLIDEKAPREPLQIPPDYVARQGAVTVHWRSATRAPPVDTDGGVVGESDAGVADDEPGPVPHAIADRAAAVIHRMARVTSLRPPLVAIVARTDLDPRIYELGATADAVGVLVRINPVPTADQPRFDEDRFLAWLLDATLAEINHNRTRREAVRWVALGGARALTRDAVPGVRRLDERPLLVRRALFALEKGPSAQWLERWYAVEEALGLDVAEAVAATLVLHLEDKVGTEAAQAFLRAVLGRAPGRSALVTARDLLAPVPDSLVEHTGLSPEELFTSWSAALEERREAHAAPLARVVRLWAEVRAPGPTVVVTADPAPGDGAPIEIRWFRPGFFQTPFSPSWVRRFSVAAGEGERFPTVLQSGWRLAFTAAVHSPELDADVISGWARVRVP